MPTTSPLPASRAAREIAGSPVPQATSSTRIPGCTLAASTMAWVMSLPMAADCLRHFWLALARPKLFQSAVSVGIDIIHYYQVN